MTNHSNKRSDIVILRALAVLFVIAYHYFPSIFTLGYLGVDIFLVISGYLMVSSYSTSRNGLNFISKRAYRLLPGLLSVAVICYILIFLVLREDLFYDYSKEILTSISGISNYYYYSKLGYFDPGAENRLFLMSWTLSLELQYYAIIALTAGWFFKSKILLLTILSASFISGFFLNESAVFYLVFSRLWEFLLGAFIYLYFIKTNYRRKIVIFSSLGFLLLLFLIKSFWLESELIFWQLCAVIFSIFALTQIINLNYMFRVFLKPMIWIGNSSYSLYLVHWPVLFFSTAFNLNNTFFGTLISIILVFIIGRLNFLYIEVKLTNFLKRKNLLLVVFLAIFSIILGLTFTERIDLIKRTTFNTNGVSCDAAFTSSISSDEAEYCTQFGNGKDNKILIWGDSHATRIIRPFVNGLGKNDSLHMIWHNGCPPLSDVVYKNSKINSGPCHDKNFGNNIVNYINNLEPDILVLVSRWPLYFNGYQGDSNQNFIISDIKSYQSQKEISIHNYLENTLKKIKTEKIIIILPPAELIKQINLSQNYLVDGDYYKKMNDHYLNEVNEIKTMLINNKEILFFDIQEQFCVFEKCEFKDLNAKYYQDTNHLSNYGADFVYESLKLLLN